MAPASLLSVSNGQAVDLETVPVLGLPEFRNAVLSLVGKGSRLSALFGHPADGKRVRLYAVLADGSAGSLVVLSADVEGRYPSLACECPQAELFERELFEQWRINPEGHPWLKPVRFNSSPRPLPGAMDYYRVSGSEVHEVAVGPVHAGIIEPGHFRFQCYGEDVLHLEIALGYQHRGIEQALPGGPHPRTLYQMETLAGDTSIGHATAYAQIVEALSDSRVPPRAESLRAIALELERLANHAGDLGALAGDVGYQPTASFCGRLRGDFLNMTALLCGNRFGRGLIRPGGVGFDVDERLAEALLAKLEASFRDLAEAAGLLWKTPSVLARFEGVGGLSRPLAVELGLVGPAARACGLERDARFEFPGGFFRFGQIPVSTWHTGDVFSRAYLRWLEIERSVIFVRERLGTLPDGPVRVEVKPLHPNRLVIALVEGWRGEIAHVALTDGQGRLARYKIVDPSFHNWKGLALAMRGGQISDFPLINKSFNLSYAGHDL
ncbi:MAG: hydrogenase [Elusimicrobiota bacterium]|jgi:Ni,Fe-hydrogenase III large subunit